MNGISIRKIKESDAEAVSGILRALGWFDQMSLEPPEQTIEHVSAQIARCIADDSHCLLVPETGEGEVAGYAAVHWLPYLFMSGPEGYVSELFVKERYRGKGIGKTLLNRIIKEAETRGCVRLMLINSRHRESYTRGFYISQGWIEREAVANFILPLRTQSDPVHHIR